MKKENYKASNKTFGYLFTFIFLCFFIFGYLKDIKALYLSFFSLTIFVFLITLIKSHWLFNFKKAWIKLGFVISKFITPIILSVIFYLIVFPINIVKKIITQNNFKNKNLIDKNKKTYWKEYVKIDSNANDPF